MKDAGLAHIIKEHGDEFAQANIKQNDIPNVILNAINYGKFLGYQGAGTGRAVYQTTVNGKPINIAVTVGSNGFIVGANITTKVPK